MGRCNHYGVKGIGNNGEVVIWVRDAITRGDLSRRLKDSITRRERAVCSALASLKIWEVLCHPLAPGWQVTAWQVNAVT